MKISYIFQYNKRLLVTIFMLYINQSQSSRKQKRNIGLFEKIFGRRVARRLSMSRQGTPIRKTNKAAIKVEPKVFFASERTFLAWLHTSVLLAGASIAITSFSEGDLLNQLYGIVLLPVSITFLCYAMHQCKRLFVVFYSVYIFLKDCFS